MHLDVVSDSAATVEVLDRYLMPWLPREPVGGGAADGLVEFIGNPKHRRSKLVQLTAKGDTRYRAMNLRLMAIASTLGADLSEGELRTTREVVRRLSDEMKGRTE